MRRSHPLLAVLAASALGLPQAACCALSAPPYHGPVSDHFDGKIFHDGAPRVGVADFVRWRSEPSPPPWPDWIESAPGEKPPERVLGDRMRVTFVNHATVLIQAGGLNVLTDPIWSERASPFGFVGPKRVRPPGLRFEDLPPIDVVLLSHNHYDHLDLATLNRLADAYGPLIVTGLGNDLLLKREGIPGARALDWWQSLTFKGARITAVQSQHICNRALCDQDATLWTAFVVETAAGRFYFAGDTGYGAHFAEVHKRFGDLRLAVLPIGAYKPEWFMGPMHETPAQAVQAQRDLGARTAVAMHFGTFPLAYDGVDEAVTELKRALAAQKEPQRFWALGFGEGRDVP